MKLSELQIFLLFIVALYIAWAANGGASRIDEANKPFLEQPSPVEHGQPYTLKQLQDGTRP